MIQLSQRLQAIADLVHTNCCVADIGTDHAYLPIYLVQSGRSNHVIAMDVNQGPLLTATNNISSYNLQDCIETRLSDGLKELTLGEVNLVIIAGMGGALIQRILERSFDIVEALDELILQPQSQVEEFRRFLYYNHLEVITEDMVYEDGIYYPIMKVTPVSYNNYNRKLMDHSYSTLEYRYGKFLLEAKHPVLYQLLLQELRMKQEIIEHLQSIHTDTSARIHVIQEEIRIVQEGLQYYDS